MIITKIEKSKGGFLLHFKDHEALFLLEGVFVRHHLYKGGELEEDEIPALLRESRLQEAIELGLKKVTRHRTRGEIQGFLSREGFEEEIIHGALAYLEDYGYINDLEYALMYVHDRDRLQAQGPQKIRFALREKGVSDKIIEESLRDYPQNRQRDNLRKLMEKRFVGPGGELKKTRPQMIRYFLQRGYYMGDVLAVLSEYEEPKNEL
ncbi:MAG: regulatory protein RecX [Tissierellia bacterium]|nr:regulatory protein RecX [Tissierellia bacterium]